MKHVNWADIPYEKVNDHFMRKLAWDGQIMLGLTEVQQGYVVPDAFTHGSSEQRVAWFRKGLESGDLKACDTFGAMRRR